jgi:copper chaperone
MIEFEVKDMSCGHCASVITKTVKLVDPEAKVQVDLGGKKVTVESTEDRTSFAEAITEAGYPTV